MISFIMLIIDINHDLNQFKSLNVNQIHPVA